ncbi:MAG: sulfurtransferase TusA family protein [Ferrovibrio sp.]|jgi:tRNA 2-thiouridine synthesizing protein A|nr:sulfurtransferase TusA family protein [Ferrovibrio sp.]
MSQVLDLRGLTCPLPVLRTKKAMQAVPKGGSLTVEATDPATQADIPALCEAAGYTLLSSTEANGIYTFNIQHPG